MNTYTNASKVDYATGTNPQSVTTADFNSDNKPDLAVASYYSNTVSAVMNIASWLPLPLIGLMEWCRE
jgi:hypothetical protein